MNKKKGITKMNLCFIIGKIISEIKFDFVLNSKHIAIVKFNVELENKASIEVVGYDKIADFCYHRLLQGDFVGILGHITSQGKIVIDEIET